MAERVGDRLFYDFQLKRIQEKQGEIQEEQSRIASGKRILKGSDDPLGMVRSSELHSMNEAFGQFSRNIVISQQRLGLADTILGSAGNILQRLKQLALRANSGGMGGTASKALAKEVFEQSQALIDLGNTLDSTGEYLFAGFKSHRRPFGRDNDGFVRYQGDGGRRTVPVSGSTEVRTSDSGDEIFMSIPSGSGHVSVFDMADRLENLIVARKQVYHEGGVVANKTLPTMTDNISINGVKLDTTIDIPRVSTGNKEAILSFSGATKPGDLKYLTFTLGAVTHKVGPLGIDDGANVQTLAQILNSDTKFVGAKMTAEVTQGGQLKIIQKGGVPIESLRFDLKDIPRRLTVRLANDDYAGIPKVKIRQGTTLKEYLVNSGPGTSAQQMARLLNRNVTFRNDGLRAMVENVNGVNNLVITSRAGRLHSEEGGIMFQKQNGDNAATTFQTQQRDTTIKPDVVIQYAGTRERTPMEKKQYLINHISHLTGVKANVRGTKLTFTSQSGEPVRLNGEVGTLTKFGLGHADSKFITLNNRSGANVPSKSRAERFEPLIKELDNAIDHLLVFRMRVGARSRKLNTQTSVLRSQTTANKSAISAIEDVDVANAATRLQQNKVLVQAAMQSLTMVRKLNLFEYMR